MKVKSALRKGLLMSLTAMMVVGLAGCGGKKAATTGGEKALSGNITGSGSSALLPLVKDAAEAFKKNHKDVSISLNAGEAAPVSNRSPKALSIWETPMFRLHPNCLRIKQKISLTTRSAL
ncbi:hypothetical protein M5E89_08550 [Acidaminococcus intestini]|nr:hypothetical protein M5E89_08550 [Acidaminococcus intestini]